jgi:long-subunit acyl-CoA synthetase (AMP-forming)
MSFLFILHIFALMCVILVLVAQEGTHCLLRTQTFTQSIADALRSKPNVYLLVPSI